MGAVVEDPWSVRLDRLRNLLPLPLLAIATLAAYVVPGHPHSHAPAVGLVLVGVAAVWSAAVSSRLGPDTGPTWRLVAFWVHTALAGVLVWVNSWFGVFAYVGFLFAYPLGGPWARRLGFTATALVVSAAMAGGYPSGRASHTVAYVLVTAVILTLVMTSANITNRALEQNRDRGQMLAELAEANARLAASMAENAELHEQLVLQAREAGVLDERQRLAGEIHDTLAQGLTGIIAQLEAAEQTRGRPDERQRHLALAQSLARTSLTEARRSVRALRPEQLEAASLPDAVGELARGWAEQSGVPADVETAGAPTRAAADVEAALFRVAQEALTNVAKHARAARVNVTLTYLEGELLLDVRDDGVGFDLDGSSDGYGLVGMRRRLARVGGTLTVESAPGDGTTVNASVPVLAS